MKPTLLVLAAGMGSRYGGLKQMDAFGPNGETLLDYSIYDAIQAGFGKVVFVIRSSFAEAFQSFFASKLKGKIEVEYVFQEITDVPEGSSYRSDREKPWGTSHAVWVARNVIKEPFVVINADDFYGPKSYATAASYLADASNTNYALVGYLLGNTLSEHGTVNRGVCQTNDQEQLLNVVETLKIGYDEAGKIHYPKEDGNGVGYLDKDTIVSMNFWCFHPDYFDYSEAYFRDFLTERGEELKSEFFIPLLIEDMINKGQKTIDVLQCEEEWFGVTYQQDKPFVQERIVQLLEAGIYPSELWS